MKCIRIVRYPILLCAIVLSSYVLLADGPDQPVQMRPLDMRTRCLVLFRECLVLAETKDANGLLIRVADGGESGRIELLPEPLPEVIKRDMRDRDAFIKKYFKSAPYVYQKFDSMLFSQRLFTSEDSVTIKKEGIQKTGHVHSIHVRIPGIKESGFDEHDTHGTIRFLEIGGKLYWLPFGW